MEAGYFEQSWRVVCFGGFLFGREAVRRMVPKGSGTLLFTGASASLRGRSGYGAFNSSKAGLRTLAQAMAKEYASDGIHEAMPVVDGAIGGERVQKAFPRRGQPENQLMSIEGIMPTASFFFTNSHVGLVLRAQRADLARELVNPGGYFRRDSAPEMADQRTCRVEALI